MLGWQIACERNNVLAMFISALGIDLLRGPGLAGNRKTRNGRRGGSAAVAYDASERLTNFSGRFRRNYLARHHRGK